MGEQWKTNSDVKLILQHILNYGTLNTITPNMLYQTIQEKVAIMPNIRVGHLALTKMSSKKY